MEGGTRQGVGAGGREWGQRRGDGQDASTALFLLLFVFLLSELTNLFKKLPEMNFVRYSAPKSKSWYLFLSNIK